MNSTDSDCTSDEPQACSCGYDDCQECSPDNFDDDGYNTQSGGHIGSKYESFKKHLESRGFTKVDNGSFRVVYRRNRVVIKVPRNGDGEIDNLVEARGWQKYKSEPTDDGIPLAPCRLLPNGCLMMVEVKMVIVDESKHKWVNKIEGWQVGEYRGRMVAYDYALSLNERSDWEEEWGVCSDYYNNGW